MPVENTKKKSFRASFAPTQATGAVGAHAMYFRAEHTGWKFVVSLDAKISPTTLEVPAEVDGFLTDGSCDGYVLKGYYGPGEEASYMPHSTAEQLIWRCSERFLKDLQATCFSAIPGLTYLLNNNQVGKMVRWKRKSLIVGH
jgi:hypothetical protein